MAERIGKCVLWLLVTILLVLAVLPFALMLITAFQRTRSLDFTIKASRITFENFIQLFTVQDFGSAILTSSMVVIIACLMNLVVCSLAAYGFTFKRFPGSEGLFWVYLATMMVPGQVTMIPMFILFKNLNLLGSYISLALPIVNAFGVFLIRQFMIGVPHSLIEAARIDGASDWRIFRSIVLPLVKPVLIALTVFTFLTTWNDFMWPLVSIPSDQYRTVTLAVAQLKGNFGTQYGMVMAGTTIAFLVPFLVYVFLQRKFVEGVTFSGLKG